MSRKMISLAGVVIAVLSFTVGGSEAEARHCRSQRSRCCHQHVSCCDHQHTQVGFRNNGTNGSCCQQSGYQQTANYSTGPTTYGTPGIAVGVNQPAPPVEPVAPVPAN